MAVYNDLFKITHNDVIPAQGSILISEPFLRDAYFQRSVVLLVEHEKEGSLGFVLNKKTDLLVNSFFPDLEEADAMPIFLGGPVCADRLFFIHSLGKEVVSNTVSINDHLYFDGNFDDLRNYIAQGNPIAGKVKFFLGYSGWTEGQLGNEIEKNSWVVSKANFRKLLQAEGEEFWKSTLSSMGSKYENWTKYPKDPYLN